MDERAILLKQSPRRTVSIVTSAEAPERAVVVKRFHHPGRLARLLDRKRAQQELRLLRGLEALGVPVPRPIELRRAPDAWELVTECVEGAVSLEDVLRRSAPAPAAIEVLARRSGEMLALAHGAGLVHRDLHPGNLLASPGGRTWLVDVRGARIERRLDAESCARDLVSLASASRERIPRALQARFLVAYLRALPQRLASLLPSRSRLAQEVERSARVHRREAVRRSRTRWTRHSSVCRPVKLPGFRGFRSVEVEEGALGDLRRGKLSGTDERISLVEGIPWRELLRCWYSAARLVEHGVPSARPLALSRAPDRWAAFALPASAQPRSVEAAERAELVVQLRDRGLALRGPFEKRIEVDGDGRGWLGPLVGVRLVDLHG